MADAGWVATSLVTLGPTMPAADDSCCGGLINMQRSRVPESELRASQPNRSATEFAGRSKPGSDRSARSSPLATRRIEG